MDDDDDLGALEPGAAALDCGLALELAEEAREEGNALFREKRVPEALAKYREAQRRLREARPMPGGEAEALVMAAHVPCSLNLAACLLREGQFADAAAEADAVLRAPEQVEVTDRERSKALFRRGSALAELGELARARSDVASAARLMPEGDASIARQQARIEALEARQKRRQQKMAAKMFGSGDLYAAASSSTAGAAAGAWGWRRAPVLGWLASRCCPRRPSDA